MVAAVFASAQIGLIELGISLGSFVVPGVILLGLNAALGLPLLAYMKRARVVPAQTQIAANIAPDGVEEGGIAPRTLPALALEEKHAL